MKALLLVLACCLSGCAATIPNTTAQVDATVDKALEVAKKTQAISHTIVTVGGPIAVTGICVVRPDYCIPAKAALVTAKATVDEMDRLIAIADKAQESPDGGKLLELATNLKKEMGNINALIKSYGGAEINTSELNTVIGG